MHSSLGEYDKSQVAVQYLHKHSCTGLRNWSCSDSPRNLRSRRSCSGHVEGCNTIFWSLPCKARDWPATKQRPHKAIGCTCDISAANQSAEYHTHRIWWKINWDIFIRRSLRNLYAPYWHVQKTKWSQTQNKNEIPPHRLRDSYIF